MNTLPPIERAVPGDGSAIARLIRRSLPAGILPLTIWHSRRAGELADQLMQADASNTFYVVRGHRGLVALAAFRRLDTQAFLNHFYVAPALRGRGLGGRLLAFAAADYLARYPARSIALDVFSDNQRARSWYRRLGFRETFCQSWCVMHRNESPGTRCSSVHLHVYQVGRLPGPYFRLTDPAAAHDCELHRALAAIDPGRRLLLIAPAASLPSGWEKIAESRRLTCDANELLGRLRSRISQAA